MDVKTEMRSFYRLQFVVPKLPNFGHGQAARYGLDGAMRSFIYIALLLLSACGATHPTDAELIAKFRENELRFETLRAFAVADLGRGVSRIEAGDIPKFLSGSHKAAYEDGFNDLGIEQIVSFRDRDSGETSVEFTISLVGIATSGSAKTIEWTTGGRDPIVGSLDPPYEKKGYVTKTWFNAYRPIGKGWYLHLTSD